MSALYIVRKVAPSVPTVGLVRVEHNGPGGRAQWRRPIELLSQDFNEAVDRRLEPALLGVDKQADVVLTGSCCKLPHELEQGLEGAAIAFCEQGPREQRVWLPWVGGEGLRRPRQHKRVREEASELHAEHCRLESCRCSRRGEVARLCDGMNSLCDVGAKDGWPDVGAVVMLVVGLGAIVE